MKTLRITVIYGTRQQNDKGEVYFLPGDTYRKVYDITTSGFDSEAAHRALDDLLDEIANEEEERANRVRFT